MPYREVEGIFEELSKSGQTPDKKQIEKAINMVKSVLDNKKVPKEVKMKKIEQIFEGKALNL